MRGEDDGSACSVLFGDVLQFFDEDDAFLAERFDDEGVMDNFVAHIDGRAVLFQRLFDDGDGSFYAGAEAAWGGEQHRERRGV